MKRSLVTRSSLASELRSLGLGQGDIACAHVAMGRLGWVCGGAQTVIESLFDAVGPDGTIMMPAYSGDLSDPEEWRHPPAPTEWIQAIRDEMPPYDAARTPSKNMGAVPELFRTWPGVRRSPHPQSSFTALGPQAAALVDSHPLDNRFGPNSPLDKLVGLDGKVLLLAAPHDTISLFHLTHHLSGRSSPVKKRAPVLVDGNKRWVSYDDIEYPYDWFVAGVEHLIDTGIAVNGPTGADSAVLLPAAAAVEEILRWRDKRDI